MVYCALEGETGFRLRVAAWEAYRGESLPPALRLMLQPFKLDEPQDLNGLVNAIACLDAEFGPQHVIIVDTLNRAAPTSDENSSKDIGMILEACKELLQATSGLVVLIHHSGKDVGKGLRGHSSLFATLDAAIELTRSRDRREWVVAKSKDGRDGDAHQFSLRVVEFGDDSHGEPMTSCIVVPDPSVPVKRAKVPQGGNQRIAWDILGPLFKEGVCGKPGSPPPHLD